MKKVGASATPMAIQPITKNFQALAQSFFCLLEEVVGPELIGCRLVKCQADGRVLWRVIVEMEAYSEDESSCRAYRRCSPQNETLLGEPERFCQKYHHHGKCAAKCHWGFGYRSVWLILVEV